MSTTDAYEEMRAFLLRGRIALWKGHHDPSPQIIGRAVCCLARQRHRENNPPAGRFLFAGYAFEWHVVTSASNPALILEVVEDILHGIP